MSDYVIVLLLCYIAVMVTLKQIRISPRSRTFLLDTSALIDGRVFVLSDLPLFSTNSWLIDGQVLRELKELADNKSPKYELQSARARYALKKLDDFSIEIIKPKSSEADDSLLQQALQKRAVLVTLDKQLINQAKLYNVSVLNPDDIRALSLPVAKVGEHVKVDVVAKAPRKNTAYGLTEWGELVMIEDASTYIGKERVIQILRIETRSNGRMIVATVSGR